MFDYSFNHSVQIFQGNFLSYNNCQFKITADMFFVLKVKFTSITVKAYSLLHNKVVYLSTHKLAINSRCFESCGKLYFCENGNVKTISKYGLNEEFTVPGSEPQLIGVDKEHLAFLTNINGRKTVRIYVNKLTVAEYSDKTLNISHSLIDYVRWLDEDYIIVDKPNKNLMLCINLNRKRSSKFNKVVDWTYTYHSIISNKFICRKSYTGETIVNDLSAVLMRTRDKNYQIDDTPLVEFNHDDEEHEGARVIAVTNRIIYVSTNKDLDYCDGYSDELNTDQVTIHKFMF